MSSAGHAQPLVMHAVSAPATPSFDSPAPGSVAPSPATVLSRSGTITSPPPKTASTRLFLSTVLANHFMFSGLAPSELAQVVEAMLPNPAQAGEVVLRQGDPLRNAFFVVEKGACDVLVDGILQETVNVGGSFGESALLYNAPAEATAIGVAGTTVSTTRSTDSGGGDRSPPLSMRSLGGPTATGGQRHAFDFDSPPARSPAPGAAGASAAVPPSPRGMPSPLLRQMAAAAAGQYASDVMLWRLDRRTFRRVLAATANRNLNAVNEALRSIPLLRSLTPSQLGKLAYAVREESYPHDALIIRKGTPGDSVYFLLHGSVVCTGIGSGATAVADVHLTAGAVFGERALLLDEPRAADVRVTSETATVLRLDRHGVTQLLGPLQDLLDRNMVIGVLKSIPVFAPLSDTEQERLASHCGIAAFSKGQAITTKGAPLSTIFIIRDGTAAALNALGAQSSTLTSGDYIGLEQVMSPTLPSLRTVEATSERVTCFALTRDSITEAVGGIRTLLARQAGGVGLSTAHSDAASDAASSRGAGAAPTPSDDAVAAAAAAQRADRVLVDTGALSHLQSIAKPLDTTIAYDDLEKLVTVGVGTFGRVYLVRHAPTGYLYALKELKKETVIRLNQTKNVQFERAVMAAVQHPFLLRLVNTYQTTHRLYMLTEYVHGGELFNLLGEYETLTSPHARFYAACVLSGLSHLHGRGIVYRDLKPENLLIDKQGYIRIVDFGFCKHVAADERTYTLCGTPAYISYEMVKGTGYNHAVDWWAFGTLIYEMLCGVAPFEGPDQMTTFKNILKGALAFPDTLTDTYARDIIRRLLAREVVDRLGCRKDGDREIFEHPWFEGVEFDALLRKALSAPWLPELESEDDAHYFESYDESDGEEGSDGEEPEAATPAGSDDDDGEDVDEEETDYFETADVSALLSSTVASATARPSQSTHVSTPSALSSVRRVPSSASNAANSSVTWFEGF